MSRQDLVTKLWAGPPAHLRWRTALRFLIRGETPTGEHFYVDAPSERGKVRDAMSRP